MPMSEYVRGIRERIGHDLLILPTCTIIAFDPDRRVLLVRHADVRLWTTPGGALDPGERPADAAVREMWEETGLTVELRGILGVYAGPEFDTTYSNGDRVTFSMTVFEGQVIAGEERPDGEETLEVRWFTAEEVAALETTGWLPQVLEDAFAAAADGRPRFAAPAWQPR